MKNWKRSAAILAMLAAMLSGHEASGQSTQQRTSSAESSPNSDTGVDRNAGTSGGEYPDEREGSGNTYSPAGSRRSIAACAAAAEELSAARKLIDVLDRENALLKERLDTEKRATSLLKELSDSRRAENDALRNAIAAKNETIFAKDVVIVNQQKLIEALKTRKSSPWKRLGDVLIGVAAGVLLR